MARIAYVDGPRLARSLFAAADWVAAGREEINRINVFPAPDGETGIGTGPGGWAGRARAGSTANTTVVAVASR